MCFESLREAFAFSCAASLSQTLVRDVIESEGRDGLGFEKSQLKRPVAGTNSYRVLYSAVSERSIDEPIPVGIRSHHLLPIPLDNWVRQPFGPIGIESIDQVLRNVTIPVVSRHIGVTHGNHASNLPFYR